MKKMIALALAMLLVLSLFAGCGASTAAGKAEKAYTVTGKFKDTKVSTITPGKMTVAISPDFAPMEFVDPTKTGQDMYVGFDVFLAKYLAEEMGLELELMPMDFGACQAAVSMGKVDMSISGFSWSDEREHNYNLSDYYYASINEDAQVLITLSANGDIYATAEGLAGARIGAQKSSLQRDLTVTQLSDSELVQFDNLDDAVAQLLNGELDCLAVADGNADAIIAAHPEIIKSGFRFVITEKQTGNLILMQKGNDAMTEAVNAVLAATEGEWEAWYNEAKSLSGIDLSFDDEGNAITE